MGERIRKFAVIVVIIVVNVISITITTISILHSINKLWKLNDNKEKILQNETTITEKNENTIERIKSS